MFLRNAKEPGGEIEPRFAHVRLSKFGIDWTDRYTSNLNPVIYNSESDAIGIIPPTARHRGTC